MGEINIKDKTLDEFFDAIMMLNGREELQRDVCTIRELHSISQRLEVAKLLKIRKTYRKSKKILVHRLLQLVELIDLYKVEHRATN